jgi:hypothetical protein
MPSPRQFTFTRIQYASGDWDTDQRMPSNLLNSLIEYTTVEVETQEKDRVAGGQRHVYGALLLPERPQAGAVQRQGENQL